MLLAEILNFLSAFQHLHLGGCPNDLQFQNEIHYEQLGGRWYEHSRYPNFLQDSNRCTYLDAMPLWDGIFHYRINVTNVDQIGNKNQVLTDEELTGGINLSDFSVRTDEKFVKEIFTFNRFHDLILSTDYTNYTIVCTCYQLVVPLTPVSLFHSRLVWILTREREPSTATLEVVHKVLAENNLSSDLLIETDQSNCDEVVDDIL